MNNKKLQALSARVYQPSFTGTSLSIPPEAVAAVMQAVVLLTLAAAWNNAMSIRTPRPSMLIRLLRSVAVSLVDKTIVSLPWKLRIERDN